MSASGNPAQGTRSRREATVFELPIDWDKAERLEPQADEPWRKPNMRKPDMLLTMENGWHGGLAHGPSKQAEPRNLLAR